MIEAAAINPAAIAIEARARAEAGYWSEALALYRVLLSSAQPREAEALLGAAQMLRRLESYSEAEQTLNSALGDYPNDLTFHLERARLLDAQARYDKVFNLLTGLLADGHKDPSIWCGILRSLRLRTSPASAAERLNACAEWLRRARAAYPKHPRVLSECGLLWIALQRPRQGLALLLQANAHDLLVQTLADLPSRQTGAESPAILLLDAAIDLLPEDADTLRTAASSLISLSQDNAAADTLAKLLALDPADQSALQQRFECLRRAGRLLEAKQVAQVLVDLDSSNAEHRLQLADTLATLGQFDQACDLIQSADEAVALLNMNSDPGLDKLLDSADPGSARLLLMLARRHSARGEILDAAWDYGRCLELSFPNPDEQVYRELLLLLREFAPPQNDLCPQSADGEPARDRGVGDGEIRQAATVEEFAKPLASHNDVARESPLDSLPLPASALKFGSYKAGSTKESAAKGVEKGFDAQSKRAHFKNAAPDKRA